jgi:hypothetical protein
MAHIQVPEGVPVSGRWLCSGPKQVSIFTIWPKFCLRGESPLSQADRELIAAYVSITQRMRVLQQQPRRRRKMPLRRK